MPKIMEVAESHQIRTVVPFSAQFEIELLHLKQINEYSNYMLANPTHVTCVHRLVQSFFPALYFIRMYVVNEGRDVRAYTVRSRTYAPHAAGVIDTDIERSVTVYYNDQW